MDEKEKILNILRHVIDPEIGINIVDLGLVYDIDISEKEITVTMTLTTPGCPMHGSMPEWVHNMISLYAPDKKVNVNLVWEPKWSPEKMSDAAKEQLGM
ncbi:metal-sulfur cluster assembly factor [Melioribacteraceae bacterium 4301-Me]|uniref:metal-sulfur cluster assembly factor n=1 Tax=Pyranulibacter aquaticus TaxID=3163344 RepID=UPI00359B7D0F